MDLLDLTLPTLAENLALDEALLLEAEAGRGGEVLRFWEWPWPGVVLGASSRLADDVDETVCQADGVPVLRRASGGGTVLLGSGCLCYSLVLAYGRDSLLREITSSYCSIFKQLTTALGGMVPELACAGTSDLTTRGRKFSGNSQQRKRNHLLHHGTLLYGFDLALISRYLCMPSRQPDYRKGRGHSEFLTNVPADPSELRRRLRETWNVDTNRSAWPSDVVRHLVREKYATPEWTRRR
jgi:lipoate-protein ligase A